MSNSTQTPEQAFHYREAICCFTCPAFDELFDYQRLGSCKRLQIQVGITNVCDKHPGWKKIFHGKGGNQQCLKS